MRFARDGKVFFDEEGERSLQGVSTYEALRLNDPVVARIIPYSTTSTRGASQFLYATVQAYLGVGVEYLTVLSAQMLKPRTQSFAVRMRPGFCPEDALPEATLSTDQMGIFQEALKEKIQIAGTSVINWWSVEAFGSPFTLDTAYTLQMFERREGSKTLFDLIRVYWHSTVSLKVWCRRTAVMLLYRKMLLWRTLGPSPPTIFYNSLLNGTRRRRLRSRSSTSRSHSQQSSATH